MRVPTTLIFRLWTEKLPGFPESSIALLGLLLKVNAECSKNGWSTLRRWCKLTCFVIKYYVSSGSSTHHAPDSGVLPSTSCMVHLFLIQSKDWLKKDEMVNGFSDLTLIRFYTWIQSMKLVQAKRNYDLLCGKKLAYLSVIQYRKHPHC